MGLGIGGGCAGLGPRICFWGGGEPHDFVVGVTDLGDPLRHALRATSPAPPLGDGGGLGTPRFALLIVGVPGGGRVVGGVVVVLGFGGVLGEVGLEDAEEGEDGFADAFGVGDGFDGDGDDALEAAEGVVADAGEGVALAVAAEGFEVGEGSLEAGGGGELVDLGEGAFLVVAEGEFGEVGVDVVEEERLHLFEGEVGGVHAGSFPRPRADARGKGRITTKRRTNPVTAGEIGAQRWM